MYAKLDKTWPGCSMHKDLIIPPPSSIMIQADDLKLGR